MGLVCIAVATVQVLFGILTVSLALALAQVLSTAAFTLFARAVVAPRLLALRQDVTVGFIGGNRARTLLDKERKVFQGLGFALEPLGESVQQVSAWFRPSVIQSRIGRLVIDDACLGRPEAMLLLSQCAREGIEVDSFSTFFERALGKVTLNTQLVGELALRERRPGALVRDAIRRTRDLVLALVGLVLAIPLGALLAIAIKCDSPGPVFFVQERIGRNGRRFRMRKFRSMRADVGVSDGPSWTTHEGDPRVTRVGAVMRLFHVDELPQLINVIRGEMSIVGPRPFHPEHCARLESNPLFHLRMIALPGITGWAQIRCDYSDSLESHEEVLARDLFYIKNASMLFDLVIMLDTLRVCLWRRGAR
jgi:lipopolysaccharide/colanic/teichoic acid biosynthesis glycosyltransferase